MRKKRFSVEQMIGVLKQAEVGVPVAEVIRKAGISEQTFYRWKAKYAGLEVDQVRRMAQLQEENLRLKQLVAELTPDEVLHREMCNQRRRGEELKESKKPLRAPGMIVPLDLWKVEWQVATRTAGG
jgi:putative transposase